MSCANATARSVDPSTLALGPRSEVVNDASAIWHSQPSRESPARAKRRGLDGSTGRGAWGPSVLQMPEDEHGSKGSDGMTAMRFNLVNPSIAPRLSRPQRGDSES